MLRRAKRELTPATFGERPAAAKPSMCQTCPQQHGRCSPTTQCTIPAVAQRIGRSVALGAMQRLALMASESVLALHLSVKRFCNVRMCGDVPSKIQHKLMQVGTGETYDSKVIWIVSTYNKLLVHRVFCISSAVSFILS